MPALPRISKSFLFNKWIIAGCVLVLLYTLVGFFLLPMLVKSQLEETLPDLLHRRVQVEEVKINPYVLSLFIKGFQVTESTGEEWASLDELYVNLQLSSLFQRSLNFKEISLKKPAAAIVIREGGGTNFDYLVGGEKSETPKSDAAKPPQINIGRLEIDGGSLSFTDLTRSPEFRTRIDPIQLTLTDFSTNPEADAPYAFSARTEPGASLSWSGTFSVNPLRSSGSVMIGGVQLKNFDPYYAAFGRFHVETGEAAFQADYQLDGSTSPLTLAVNHAEFELKNLKVNASDTQQTVVSLPSLTVKEANADIVARSAAIDSIALEDGSILVRRERDGTINLLALIQDKSRRAEPSVPAAPNDNQTTDQKAGWQLSAKDVRLVNFSVTAEDMVPDAPARMKIDHLNLKLSGIAYPEDKPMAVEASLRWNESGTIAASGALRHSPVFADLDLSVTRFDLRPFQPYLDQQANLQLASGSVTVGSHIVYGAREAGAPLVRFAGDVSIDNVDTVDKLASKTFVAWDALTLNGVRADVSPTNVSINELRWKHLKSYLSINPNGQTNVAALLRTGSGPTPDSAEPRSQPDNPQRSKPPVAIKAFLLEDAAIYFADRSIQPPFAADIRKLNGRVQGLSTNDLSKAKVALSGKVDAQAPLEIAGRVNPLGENLFADMTFSLKGFDMPPLSSYTGKYAGYPLQKGKLSADLRYKVEQRKLQAENSVLIDQLTLGPHTDSPDATSLPVKLAIAILQDRRGKIQLDVPVSGSLNDPEFRLGKVIWRAFVNILEKVATSPFALLGSVIGGGGEELSFVGFSPGSTALADTETQKLERLAKALTERPSLNLEIKASADPVNDRLALARNKLVRSFKQQKLKVSKELKSTQAVSPDDVPLDEQEYERLVRLAYARMTDPARQVPATAVPTEPLSVPEVYEEPEKKSGFWEFLSRLNPFKSSKKERKKEPPAVSPETEREAAASAQGPSFEEMERYLLEKQNVSSEDFQELMQDRAQQVQGYLLKTGGLDPQRIFIAAPEPVQQNKTGESKVTMALK